MGQAVLINLVSSLAAFLFGLAAREGIRRWTDIRPARKVWRIDRSVAVSIVTSDGPDSGWRDVRSLWEADALAATAAAQYLGHAFGISVARVTTFESFPAAQSMENNLVIIGGPSMNGLYRYMAERIKVPYAFELFPDRSTVVRDSDQRKFAQVVKDGRTMEDYAVITLARNPFRPMSRLVMLAGCGATGTLAAAKLVTSGRVREVAELVKSKDFTSIVIHVEMIHGYMAEPRVVDYVQWGDAHI